MADFSIDTARMLINFAIQAYKDPENFDVEDMGFHMAKFIENKSTDTQLYLAKNENQVVIAFRGTSSVKDALNDLNILKRTFPKLGFFKRLFKLRSIFNAKAHEGFYEAYNSIRDDLHEAITYLDESGDYEFYLTGHSLGGALATIAALDITRNLDIDPVIYTYGAPKAGNKRFVRLFNSEVKHSFRVVNDEDPVPSVPGTTFKHVDHQALIDEEKRIIIDPGFFERVEKGLESIQATISAEALKEHSTATYKVLVDNIDYP